MQPFWNLGIYIQRSVMRRDKDYYTYQITRASKNHLPTPATKTIFRIYYSKTKENIKFILKICESIIFIDSIIFLKLIHIFDQ